MMFLRNFYLTFLLVNAICLTGLNQRTNALEVRGSDLASMSVKDFFKLDKTQQKKTLFSAVKQRLQLFENIEYSTKIKLTNPEGDWTAFPYGDKIPIEPTDRIAFKEYVTKKLEGSYLTETKRGSNYFPNLHDFTASKYDISVGEFKGINTRSEDGEDQSHAAIDTVQDRVDKEDRFAYWGTGSAEPRGVYFINESFLALDKHLKASETNDKSTVTIKPGQVGKLKTIALTFQSIIPKQVGRDGILTIEFDPERQFLPVSFRLERFTESGKTKKVRWFEAMLVIEAFQKDGIWLPKQFQLFQSNALPTSTAMKSVYDVKIESVNIGSLSPQDLEFKFPAGIRVVDRIREVSFISDGKGGAKDGKFKSIAQLDLSGAAETEDSAGFNGFSLLLLNIGCLLIFCGVFLIRRKMRLHAQKSE